MKSITLSSPRSVGVKRGSIKQQKWLQLTFGFAFCRALAGLRRVSASLRKASEIGAPLPPAAGQLHLALGEDRRHHFLLVTAIESLQ
jgi:hypothetical protein